MFWLRAPSDGLRIVPFLCLVVAFCVLSTFETNTMPPSDPKHARDWTLTKQRLQKKRTHASEPRDTFCLYSFLKTVQFLCAQRAKSSPLVLNAHCDVLL